MAKYGVVVVGLGIAGRARVRDISDEKFNVEGKWKLEGVVTRRALDDTQAPVMTDDEMLKREDVNVVVVCTEPAHHESIIRKALHHGKNILVEFPVVPSASVTKEFYNIAREKGLLLHEENIALLTPGFLSLKQQIFEAKSSIVKGEISLIGNYNGWAEDFEGSGGPFCTNISLIQTLYELFGEDLRAIGGVLKRNDAGFTATAQLTCAKCNDLTLSVSRKKERTTRKKTSLITLEGGTTFTENPELVLKKPSDSKYSSSSQPGLFMQDFLLFIDKLEKNNCNSHDTQRVLRCIEIAEDIHSFMGLKGKS